MIGSTDGARDRSTLAAPFVETSGMKLVAAWKFPDALPAFVVLETDVALFPAVLGRTVGLAGIEQHLRKHVGEADHLRDHGKIDSMVEPDIELPDTAAADTDFQTVWFLAARLDIIDDGMQPVFHIVILLEEIKLVFFIPTQAFFFWVDSLFIRGK